MSSPARTLGPVPTASRVANVKKRILTDSEDTEERELKRVRPQDGASGEQGKQREIKDKKRRRKKKRKLSVVQAAEGSDTELPVLAPKPSITRVRSRSVASAGPAEVKPTPLPTSMEPSTPQPSAGLSAGPSTSTSPPAAPQERLPTPPLKEDPEPAETTTASTVDKGKGRAAPDNSDPASTTASGAEEVAMLKEQVSTKANIITQHENLVSTLQQSLSCQICLDLMYKPFALSPCGHSACYPCLVNWFKAPPADVPANEVAPPWLRKKTCPHCRTVIKERPIEIWAIKEMVASLAKSGLAQNLPPSESAEGAANADPWAGIFQPARGNHNVFPDEPYPVPLQQLMGLRDDEDGGIYRCIECHHEIWDGACSQCGRVYPGHGYDGSDEDDDDSMHELWRDEAEEAWAEEDDALLPSLAVQQLRDVFFGLHAHAQGTFAGWAAHVNDDNESLDPDWDDGGDTEIDSDSDGGHWRHHAPLPPVQPAHIEEVEEDEEEHGSEGEGDGYESSFIDDGGDDALARGAILRRLVARQPQPVIELSDDDELADDDGNDDARYVGFGARRAPAIGRGRGPLVILSDDEDDDEPAPVVDYGGVLHDYRTIVEPEDEIGSDYHSYRDPNDRIDEFDEDEDDVLDDDLADQVAAREYDIYGDDGSVPRGGARYYSDEEGDDDDDYY